MDSYCSDKKLVQNTIYNFSGKVLILLVGIACIPFLIHKIGLERFGILTLAWSVIGYFGLFDLGVGRATTKFVAEQLALKNFEELPSLVWTSLFLLGICGLAGGVIFGFLTPVLIDRVFNIPPGLLEETRQTFYLLAGIIPLLFCTAGASGVLEAQQRFALINAINVPASIGNFLFPLVAAVFSPSLVLLVGLMALIRLLVLAIFMFFCLRSLPQLTTVRFFSLKYAKKLLTFGSWLMLTNIIGPLMAYFDRFVIPAFLTLQALAYYVTPYELATRLWIIPASLTPVLFPAFSAYAAEGNDKAAALQGRAVKYIFLVLSPLSICLIVLAKPIFQLWLGADFALNSAPILQLLVVGILINSIAFVPYSAIQATGRPDLPAKLHLLELPLYLVLLWVLIHQLGLLGVALAWVLRVGIDTSCLFWLSSRLLPAKATGSFNFRGGLIGATALFVIASYFLAMVPNLGVKIIFLSLILCFFGFLSWRFLLNDSEKAQVGSVNSRMVSLFSRGPEPSE